MSGCCGRGGGYARTGDGTGGGKGAPTISTSEKVRDDLDKQDALVAAAKAICAAYGDDFDEQPKDLAELQEWRKRERGSGYDGIHSHDPGLPTQSDWLECADAAYDVLKVRSLRVQLAALRPVAEAAVAMEAFVKSNPPGVVPLEEIRALRQAVRALPLEWKT